MPQNINCIPLQLPPCSLTLKPREDGYGEDVFDFTRRRYVKLTPEEWVRQHFVCYLVNHLEYPSGLIANEVEIEVGNVKKRCDSIVYDKSLQPVMLLEYKAPQVALTKATVNQALRYNLECRVPVIVLSNGLTHMAFGMNYDDNRVSVLNHIPNYNELISDSNESS